MVLSIVALIKVTCSRCELFSSISLFLFAAVSAALSALQVISLLALFQYRENLETELNYIGGVLTLQLLSQITSIPLYSTVHNLFALQYLRASLTVPLYFER